MPAIGIHPHDAANVQEKDIVRLGELAKHARGSGNRRDGSGFLPQLRAA